VIKVDYETLSVSGDMTARFKTKEEMEKAVKKYVVIVGKERGFRPYIFEGKQSERKSPSL
jgi:hypothetical protein